MEAEQSGQWDLFKAIKVTLFIQQMLRAPDLEAKSKCLSLICAKKYYPCDNICHYYKT